MWDLVENTGKSWNQNKEAQKMKQGIHWWLEDIFYISVEEYYFEYFNLILLKLEINKEQQILIVTLGKKEAITTAALQFGNWGMLGDSFNSFASDSVH